MRGSVFTVLLVGSFIAACDSGLRRPGGGGGGGSSSSTKDASARGSSDGGEGRDGSSGGDRGPGGPQDASTWDDAETRPDAWTWPDAEPRPDASRPDGGLPIPIGAACASAGECPGGQCLPENNPYGIIVPDGYCTQMCNASISCPSGSLCYLPSGTNIGMCGQACTSNSQCRGGYECRSSAPRVCFPPEAAPPPPVGSEIGGPCASASDCKDSGADCLTDFPGGYCWTFNCSPGSCPAGAECFQIDQNGTTACLKECTATSQCGRTEYICVSGVACFPSCAHFPCSQGLTCAPNGECQ